MIALLACVAILTGPEDPSARAWAEGLASSNAEVRFATIDAIEARGTKAIATLREVIAKSSGAARGEAAEILDRLSHRRLLQPTRVSLGDNLKDAASAVATLREQTSSLIDFFPDDEAKWRERPIGGLAEGAIPFLEAIDRVGASAGFRIEPAGPFTYPPKGGVRLRLIADEGPRPPSSYSGPYRVTLVELERHRSVSQARNPDDATIREEFTATIDVLAEPGILIERNGAIRIQEAVDEKGRDLTAPPVAESHNAQFVRPWAMESVGTFISRVPLRLPADRGQRIARLRGIVPITAVVRTDEIFNSPIQGLQGKTIEAAGISMRVNQVNIGSGAGSMEIIVKGESPPGSQGFAAGPRQTALANLRLSYNLDDHLRVEDADGHPYTTSSTSSVPITPDGSVTFRVSLFPSRPLKPAARIRYFGVAGVATEIPFDFRDLPIP